MIRCGSVAAAKEKGLLRSEGKEYVVRDGDMIDFRFNVYVPPRRRGIRSGAAACRHSRAPRAD